MKNLTIFRTEKGWKPDFDLLKNNLSMPDKLGFGWKVLRNDEPVITVGGNNLITLEKQEKLLPKQVIENELKLRIYQQIEEEQGYKVGKKMKRDLKEQITESLYAKAFTVSKFFNVWINTEHDLMCVETTSESAAEDVLKFLIRDFGWSGKRFNTFNHIESFMRGLIVGDDSIPEIFSLGRSCVLQDRDESGKKITYKNESLDTGIVSNYVMEGKRPVKLEISLHSGDEGCFFTIDNKFIISKITLANLIEDHSEFDTDDDYFDNEFAIRSGQCLQIINSLIETLGEESVDQQSEAA
ncbi:MAG: recombination-associated protein RdgC [Nitrosomonas sp.]|nr:recombination-associated protein RdgC [Nitrosomonas sp.]